MIKNIREALSEIKDKNFSDQIETFCTQEDSHARAHEIFNNHLKSNGIDVDKYHNNWLKKVKK